VYLDDVEIVENQIDSSDIDISYKLLFKHGSETLERAAKSETISVDAEMIDKYWEDLKKHHFCKLICGDLQ